MAIIQVTTTADSGVGSLRDAIAQAASGDEIRFSLANGSTITLTSGEISIPEAKDLTIDGTGVTNLTISGNNASRIFNLRSNSVSTNTFTLKNLTLANGVATESLDANSQHLDISRRGGAILVSGSSSTVTVDNVTFNDNEGSRGGGAIYSTSNTKLIVLNSKFNRNNGQGENEERAGGAITFRGADELIVKNSEFIDNTGVNGGAINTVHGKLTIDNSRFINNTSDGVFDPSQPADESAASPDTDARRIRGYGGAVYVDSGHESTLENTGYIRIYGSVFEGNQGKGAGGAAYIYTVPGDKVIIDSSSFENNQVQAVTLKPGATMPPGYEDKLAPGNGGAVNQTSNADIGANAGFTITNSTFANNTATGQGGGLWKNVSKTSIVNSTFFGNRAENLANPGSASVIGGGMALYGDAKSPDPYGFTTLTNTTIADNFAGWMGGGLAADSETGVTVNNTIFSNNIGNRGGAVDKIGSQTNRLLITIGQNNIQFPNRTAASTDFLAVLGIQVADPLLGPLQDNGGPTKTMELLPGSPAIDAGANIGTLADAGANIGTLVSDQRGNSRQVDGNGDGISVRDIGAVEASSGPSNAEVGATLNGINLIDANLTPFDFGQTSFATPVNRTLNITNSGTGILSLNGLQHPTGFSLLGSLPSSLEPGASANLTIQLTASDPGQFGGLVLFTTNDSDEGLFSFAIKGSVTEVWNGTAGNDSKIGSATDEIMSGLDGNDTLVANSGNDTVNGGAGNDSLIAGVGLNSLVGGVGNDNYLLNNPLDIIVETSTLSTEIDTITIDANYTLGTNVENLTLIGTNNFNAAGNSIKNLITGNSGLNTISGDLGDDHLRGMDGNDSLIGGGGNDILDLNGSAGNDTLDGGVGNDSYYIDNDNDIANETSTVAAEIDRVISSVNYSLGNNIEFLTLTGGVAITATGNQLNNWLVGNALNNSLFGGQGNDTLDGSTGEDTLEGGTGNDSYTIADSTDIIIETSSLATELDTVRASINYTLEAANVENLTLIGTATIGSGNNLNNIINGNVLNNTLDGGLGNDTIIDSLGGHDSLDGGNGNDNLNPGAGNDTLAGGIGNDIYQIDSVEDVVIETSPLISELDHVISTITYTLGANLNLLTLSGTANIDGTGNELSNTITGNSGINLLIGGAGNDNITGGTGNDTITGGTGNDTITGGAGNDSFTFSDSADKRDQILDFTPGQDIIAVSSSGFGGGTIPLGPLASDRLAANVASMPQAQFIYESLTGNLRFDSDGNGPTPASDVFAILTTQPSISSTNIVVVNQDTSITYGAAALTASVTEGASPNTIPISFIVTRTGATTANASSIEYNLGGTAALGSDYELQGITGNGITTGSNLITFAAGATVATITLNVLGDATNEPNEGINLTISNPSPAEATIAVPSVTTTIVNDDPIPQIISSNITIAEGDTGTTNANFTVSLNNPSSETITVNFTTANGTATAESDYTATSGTLTFAPGELNQTIAVPIIGDTEVELGETFNLNLSSPINATLPTSTFTGFIENDEHLPSSYSIVTNSLTIPEGAAPNSVLDSFVITRSNYTEQSSSIDYTFSGIATLNDDYQLFTITGNGISTSGNTINFAVGATTATLTLKILGGPTYEPDEDINVTLSNPSPVTGIINTPTATSIIQNDDSIPSITSSNITFLERNLGTSNATFTVTLPNPSYQTITVDYATVNGSAISGSDYNSTSGTLTFAPGETIANFDVTVIGDTNIEPQETFLVNFTNPTNATIGTNSVTGFINNDDTQGAIDYTIVANTDSVTEGAPGNITPITFVITRNNFVGTTSSVGYVFTTSTAAQNFDFNVGEITGTDVTSGSGRITFATGASLATLTLNVTGDSTIELDEPLVVTLNNADTPNTTISIPNATTLIVNDDNPIVHDYGIIATTASVTEGNSPDTTPVTFVVSRSGSITSASSIRYIFTGVAAQNFDFNLGSVTGTGITESSGRITFASGATVATITLNVTGDSTVEPDEDLTVTLNTPDIGASTISTPSATTIIVNDDTVNTLNYSIAATTASITEGAAGNTTPISFVVTRSGSINLTSSIRYGFSGTAALNSDYTLAGVIGTGITENAGRITFASGSSLATINLNVTGDHFFEADEALTLNLTFPDTVNTTISTPSATTTIVNDDAQFRDYAITATTASVIEGAAGNSTPVTFIITRTGAINSISSIRYGFTGSIAAQNSDFVVVGSSGTGITENSGRVTFASGASLATVTVNITGDSTVEPDENLIVTLTIPSNASDTISIPTATTQIVNDDGLNPLNYAITATTSTVTEGAAENTTPINFVVTRSGSVNLAGSILYSLSGTAALNSDYTLVGVTGTGITENSGRITFASGSSLATITLNVTGDSTIETDESITLTLSSPDTTNTTISTPSGTTIIANDDLLNIDYAIIATTASVTEGNSPDTTPVTFVVTRSGSTDLVSSIRYAFTNGVAVENSDFALVDITGTGVTESSGRITFASGASLATINLNIIGDSTFEANEALTVTLTTPDTSNTTISTPSATTVIANDDTQFRDYAITATTASVIEGAAGNSTPVTFIITRTGAINSISSIRYGFTGSVAAQNSDFVLVGSSGTGITENSGRVTFASGASLATVTVNITGDSTVEPDENLIVTLTIPSNANDTISTPTATTQVINDDSASSLNYAIAANTSTINEGAAGITTPISFVLTRSGSTNLVSSIRYAFTGSVAVQNSDFALVGVTGTGVTENSGRITFASGASLATINLNVIGDWTFEANEALTVALTSPDTANTTISTASATTVIANDDAQFRDYAITATTVSVIEGAPGNSTPVTFVITRTGAINSISSIRYGFTGSVAAQNSDFVVVGSSGTGITENSGRVTFASGASLATVTVNITGDSTVEPDENLIVTLTIPSNASDTISIPTATTQVLNDDGVNALNYAITATTSTVTEGAEGNTTPISFVITCSGSVNLSGSVLYDFNGTAALNSDYTLVGVTGTGITENSGRITFASGASLATITLNVTGDSTIEPDENITLTLSNPDTANTTITPNTATTIIAADDFSNLNYTIIATTASVSEGASGATTPITFVVNRSGSLTTDSSIGYGFLTSVATQNSDFVLAGVTGTGITENSGRITFASGASLATITLNVTGDSTVETDEALIVTLTNPSNGADTISIPTATTQIINDDTVTGLNYAISANIASVTEGAVGETTPISFVITRSGLVNLTGSIRYGFSGTAALNSDYTLVGVTGTGTGITENSGRITFASGESLATINLNVTGDYTFESDEAITLTLTNPDTVNTTITPNTATTTIVNDDFANANYGITANTSSVTEGAAGNSTPITFIVNRSGAIYGISSIRYAFTNSVAAQNFDFNVGSVTGTGITESSGRITFAASATVATITLNVTGDSTYELDENLTVTLTTPSNAADTISPQSATTVVINDEPLPNVKVNALNLVEGNSGTTMANFVVYLNYTSPQAITVDFTTADGTATSGSDYTGTSGTITFSAGQSSRTIAVPVIGETLYESNEIFTFNLSNVNNATLGTTSVNGTITNDDLTLVGTSGADSLLAGAEHNTLIGNGGADTLTGGPGYDHYVYNSLSDGGDTITDFRVGQDKINLNALLTDIGYAGSNPITDGYVQFVATTSGGVTATNILIDTDGSIGSTPAVQYILCQNIHISSLNSSTNFIF